jgi:gluconokinase
VIVIVAGVAGCGKSTIGILLARALNWQFEDGDLFHSPASLAKMRAGIPLSDEDRKPWLQACTDWMDAKTADGQSGVLACSALKRRYRDTLLSGRPNATIVFLMVPKDVLVSRLTSRQGHFFPVKLMESQMEILQPPEPDEAQVRTVTPEGNPARTVAKIVALLWPHGQPAEPA